jgi:hypothetical protein
MTTRALAALAATVAVLVAIATTLIWTLTRVPTPSAATPQPTPTVAAATPTPSDNSQAGDAAEQEGPGPAETQEAAWGPVVDTFARNFTNTRGGVTDWRRRLTGNPHKPDVTTEVAGQLKTVDLRNVPEGHYSGRQILKSGDYDLAVKVTYREGWALVLYLVTDGTTWQVYAYDRWQP